MLGVREQIEVVAESGLLDREWYAREYRDVSIVGMDEVEHYVRYGWRLGRAPAPSFSTTHYLAENPDVADTGICPLVHFILAGEAEGRSPVESHAILEASERVLDGESEQIARAERAALSGIAVKEEVLRSPRPDAATIVVVAHVAGSSLFGGERSFLDVVAALDHNGHDVVVVLPSLSNREYVARLAECSQALVSFSYPWWRDSAPIDEVVVAEFADVLARYRADAVHVNTIMPREPLVAGRRLGIPAVVHVREIVEHDPGLCAVIGESPEKITRDVLEMADYIVANSRATAECFTTPDRTIVVRNSIDLAEFGDGSPVSRSGKLHVALISSNLPKKGIDDFVSVAKVVGQRRSDVEFILIGPETDRISDLRRGPAGLPNNLRIAGYVDDPRDAVGQADVIVNFSHFRESFGRTILEAMAGGRATLAYDHGALNELIIDGETGFLVPFGDVDSAARRIEEMAKDRGLVSRMGLRGRKYAEANLTERSLQTALSRAYEKILAPRLARHPKKMVLRARSVPDRAEQAEAKEKLKIAYVVWHFPVPSETFILNELRELIGSGHDVQVFCRQSPYPDFAPDFDIEWERVEGHEELARRLVETSRSVAHGYFTYPTVTNLTWPACELAHIPFTLIAHAQDIFRYSNDKLNRIGEIGNSPLCRKIFVPAQFHRDYVRSRGVPGSKIFINPNGLDPEDFRTGVEVRRTRKYSRSVCTIGRFTEKKGLEILIRSGGLLREQGIDIHVYGYGDLEDEFRNLIRSDGLDNVHIRGAIEGVEARVDVLNSHDAFVCPSVRASDGDMDGIPTTLLEAMSAEVPVIATQVSGIPDLVHDGTTGFVCDPTPESVADAIMRFYSTPLGEVDAILDAAVRLVRSNHDVTRLVRALTRVWADETFDIVIVSWNNLPELREVIGRLFEFTESPFHLTVCDNGSDMPTVAFLLSLYATQDNCTCILNRENVKVGPGTNIALAHSWSDTVVYVCGKEGFVVRYGWERGVLDQMAENESVGLAGSIGHSPTYLRGRDYSDGIPLFAKFRNQEFAELNPEREFGHVQGGLFTLRRSMFESIGGFSDEVPHEYTDVEYSFYAESCGWKLGEIPQVLALYKKTRPDLLARIDEHALALHPPRLDNLPLLDRIARREVRHCGICGWSGSDFDRADGDYVCPRCGSTSSDRSLHRYLAESTLTFQRLAAIGVGLGVGIRSFWREQFQGVVFEDDEFRALLRDGGQTPFQTSSMRFVYVHVALQSHVGGEMVARECRRLLGDDGLLLIRSGTGEPLPVPGFRFNRNVRRSSQVARYDWHWLQEYLPLT